MAKLCLIDGDVLLYRATAAVQTSLYILYDSGGVPRYASPRKRDLQDWGSVYLEEGHGTMKQVWLIDEDSYDQAQLIIKSQIKSILKANNSTDFIIYLSGGTNYRYAIFPDYKGNRTVPKPVLYKAISEWVKDKYALSLEETDGIEADDALGIRQYSDYRYYGEDSQALSRSYSECSTVICTNDKDLLMIPGHHYNFVTDQHRFISELEGYRNFYQQLLTGDTVDNIPGLYRVGPKTAEKMLAGIDDVNVLDAAVHHIYCDRLEIAAEEARELMNRNGNLLWIQREEGKLYA